MRLKKAQKEHLLGLISEGLETVEINQRAALFRPRYQVSRQQVDAYRKSRSVRVREIQEQAEDSALKRGFALKENRVATLDRLARQLEDDLLGPDGKGLWLDDVKMIGTGDFQREVEFQAFNQVEVNALRNVLDDIAKETGDRKQKVEHSGHIDVSKLSDEELQRIVES